MISHLLAPEAIAERGDRKQTVGPGDVRRTQRPATAFEKRCAAWLNTPVVWLRRMRLRNELASIDPHLLRDVGLDPVSVRRESEKPFWQD